MTINGSVKTVVSGQVAGKIFGDVDVKGRLVVSKEGMIKGNITALEVIVQGIVNGDIRCKGKMQVQSGAYIKGNIETDEIYIEKDSKIDGLIVKSVHSPDSNAAGAKITEEKKEEKNIPPQLNTGEDNETRAWF